RHGALPILPLLPQPYRYIGPAWPRAERLWSAIRDAPFALSYSSPEADQAYRRPEKNHNPLFGDAHSPRQIHPSSHNGQNEPAAQSQLLRRHFERLSHSIPPLHYEGRRPTRARPGHEYARRARRFPPIP